MASPPAAIQLAAEPFASGFGALTFVANTGDGSGMLYAVQQQGFITYLFSDYCTGTIWGLNALTALENGSAAAVQIGPTGLSPSAFGEDESGELYLVDPSAGAIYRIVAANPSGPKAPHYRGGFGRPCVYDRLVSRRPVRHCQTGF